MREFVNHFVYAGVLIFWERACAVHGEDEFVAEEVHSEVYQDGECECNDESCLSADDASCKKDESAKPSEKEDGFNVVPHITQRSVSCLKRVMNPDSRR